MGQSNQATPCQTRCPSQEFPDLRDGIPIPAGNMFRCQNRRRPPHSSQPVIGWPRRLARFVGLLLITTFLLNLASSLPGLLWHHPSHPTPTDMNARHLVLVAAWVGGIAGAGSFISKSPGPSLGWPSMWLATVAASLGFATILGVEPPPPSLGPMAGWLGWSSDSEFTMTLLGIMACLVTLTIAWWLHLRASGGHRPPAPRVPGRHSFGMRMAMAHGRGGFTALEMAITILVLGILVVLFLPAIAKAKAMGHTARCLAQARQMAVAMNLYAADFHEHFPPNLAGPSARPGQTWVQGWLGAYGPDCTNTLHLSNSLLAPYLKGVAVWKCPATGPVQLDDHRVAKARSFSINGFVGSPLQSPVVATFRKHSDLGQMSPAALLAFVEEQPASIDDGALGMQWDFDEAVPTRWRLQDQPAVHHGRAGNLTWVDGHAETRRWRDLPTAARRVPDQPAPGLHDVLWLQQHGTFRHGSDALANAPR